MAIDDPDFTWLQFSDIHLGSPRSFRFQPAWDRNFEFAVEQAMTLDPQPDFVVIGGDLARDGDTHRFELDAARARLEDLPWPYLAIPGNHCVGDRYHPRRPTSVNELSVRQFIEVIGDDRFAFTAKGVRFVGFNSQLFGSSLPREEDQWGWLEAEAGREGDEDARIWIMHAMPFTDRPGEPVFTLEENLKAWYVNIPESTQVRLAGLCRKGRVSAVACGHVHIYHDVTVDGIRRVMCPATAFRGAGFVPGSDSELGFIEWRMEGGEFEPRLHRLEKTSDLKGYGPGGNIALPDRNYDDAQEPGARDDPHLREKLIAAGLL